MTEKILREMIAIDVEPIDFVTIVASNKIVEFKLHYGWNGMEFKILITSSNSSTKRDYSTKSVQPIFIDFTRIINEESLQINYVTYVLNQEHGIFIQNYFKGNDVKYTIATKMLTIDVLNVLFYPVNDVINYTEASVEFNAFVNNLMSDYKEFKIEIIHPTPKELCRKKKLLKIFTDS